jgi:hypothetical protein
MNCTVEFPVELGQKVWKIRTYTNEVEEATVDKLIFKQGRTFMQLSCDAMYETSCRSLGKTVFLSKEEAEEGLKSK